MLGCVASVVTLQPEGVAASVAVMGVEIGKASEEISQVVELAKQLSEVMEKMEAMMKE